MKHLLATLFGIVLHSSAHAMTADEIIDNARDVQRINNGIQQMQMTLVARNGAKRERKFEMRVRKDGEIIRSYVRFSHPSDVAGTQLVIVDNPDKVDEQLLYLPALKRTNRIAGKARKGSFMGSDFSFEDLEVSSASDAQHNLVSQTDTVWIIDTKPGADSSYGRIRSHVSKSDYLPRLVEFFDTNDQPKKTLEVLKTATENGSILPTHSVMKNLSKSTSTEMTVSEWRLNVSPEEIPEETFTVGYLERNG